jgi:dephospho-CoA kinase
MSRRPTSPLRTLARKRPPFIGLTGGIGAGKSTALAAFARLGAETLSTDAVVHELYESGDVRDAVIARFGSAVAPGGQVDRARLAELAFATPEDRAWLEQLIWPLVGARVAAFRAAGDAADPAPPALVVEVPLLFESGIDRGYDAIVAVVVDEAVRDARAAARGYRALAARAARQLSQAEKAARATYVIENDGDVAELENRLSGLLHILSR